MHLRFEVDEFLLQNKLLRNYSKTLNVFPNHESNSCFNFKDVLKTVLE